VEIVIRSQGTETVVKPEAGTAGTAPATAQQGSTPAAGATGMSAGPAPSPPGSTGAPPVNVAATEVPRAPASADQSAGEAPSLS
jgi:hypothetical protein